MIESEKARCRILVLGKYYYPYKGGIEDNAKRVCETLANFHNVTAVVHANDHVTISEKICGVVVRRFGTVLTIASQPISLGMLSSRNYRGYDIIHFHAPNPFASVPLLLFLMRSPKTKLVITHHMDISGRRVFRYVAIKIYHALCRRANRVIVTSSRNAEISRDLSSAATVVEIPLSVDLTEFQMTNKEKNEAHRWRIEVFGDAPMLAFVGRHVRYKGLPVLMHAMVALPGVKIAIAGSGPLTPSLKVLVKKLKITERVVFLGEIDHDAKLRLLHSCDIFVFPSTEVTEAFGISQLEAMAMRAPVVSTDLPTGVTDVSIHEWTALLSSPGDPQSLAAAIRRLLMDHPLAERLAANAYDRLLARFTHKAVMEKTQVLFQQVIDEG